MLWPLPTLHKSPSLRRPCACQMLLQANEGFFPRLESRKSVLGKYFPHITWAARESGLFKSLQHYLASKAVLKQSMSLNPRPPRSLLLPILLQAIQAILLEFSLKLHQNFPIMALISFVKAFGMRNMLIVYVGIAWMTAFSKTSFPACVRNFSFQPFNLAQILSLMKLKEETLDLPIRAGSPRYRSKH
jgi:hypothetical protein